MAVIRRYTSISGNAWWTYAKRRRPKGHIGAPSSRRWWHTQTMSNSRRRVFRRCPILVPPTHTSSYLIQRYAALVYPSLTRPLRRPVLISDTSARPCQRCIKRGMADNCTEGHRKKAKYLLDEEELGQCSHGSILGVCHPYLSICRQRPSSVPSLVKVRPRARSPLCNVTEMSTSLPSS